MLDFDFSKQLVHKMSCSNEITSVTHYFFHMTVFSYRPSCLTYIKFGTFLRPVLYCEYFVLYFYIKISIFGFLLTHVDKYNIRIYLLIHPETWQKPLISQNKCLIDVIYWQKCIQLRFFFFIPHIIRGSEYRIRCKLGLKCGTPLC